MSSIKDPKRLGNQVPDYSIDAGRMSGGKELSTEVK